MSQDDWPRHAGHAHGGVALGERCAAAKPRAASSDLARVLDDDGHLASLARYDDGDRPPLFDPRPRRRPVPPHRRRVDRLPVDGGDARGRGARLRLAPRHGRPGEATVCLGHRLRAARGRARWQPRSAGEPCRRCARRFAGSNFPLGWLDSAEPRYATCPARVTAVVVGPLHEAGEDDAYVTDRVGLIVDLLDHRAPGAELARPFVLATSLIELSRSMSTMPSVAGSSRPGRPVQVDDGARGWPVFVRESAFGPRPSSTVHTAMSVCAIAAWAAGSMMPRLDEVAVPGRHGWSGTRTSISTTRMLSSDRDDGASTACRSGTSPRLGRAGSAGGRGRLIERACRPRHARRHAPLRLRGRHLADGRGAACEYPVWMTYQGVAALTAWAAHTRSTSIAR